MQNCTLSARPTVSPVCSCLRDCAGNSAGSAGLLKETLAALRAALNFSKSAFPMQNAGIFPRPLFSSFRRNAPCPPRRARRLQNRGGALNNFQNFALLKRLRRGVTRLELRNEARNSADAEFRASFRSSSRVTPSGVCKSPH